jgi:4-amino-4-deoxy-L-arabinose transferase-like glycosyltransferase
MRQRPRFLRQLGELLTLPTIHVIRMSRRRALLTAFLIFLIAFAVRFTGWYYWRAEAIEVQSGVTANYKRLARLFVSEGITAFFQRGNAMSDPDLLGHPPGYPFLLAVIYRISGESDAAIQMVQITADAVAAVILFFIAYELLGISVGLIASLLAGFSPQFTWNSLLLLPDTISVLPLLLAIYLVVLGRHNRSLSFPLLAGALIGASCLLRPNNLLLAPVLALMMAAGLVKRASRLRVASAAVLLFATLFVVAPVTVRNWLVFDRFIPLSLGVGQTLLEGIADYDPKRRFGIPETDVEIAQMEAKEFQRPDYAETLFGPDGIERERHRLKRGFQIIRSNPIWFAGVMAQRAVSMLRFERVPIIDSERSRETGYPVLLRIVQKVYLTVFMLPLVVVGIAALAWSRRWSTLAILLVIPFYYFVFQSALHTESRYIIALHYFLLLLAAIGVHLVIKTAGVKLFRTSR